MAARLTCLNLWTSTFTVMNKFCQDFNPQFFYGSIFAIQRKSQIAKGLLSGHLRPLAWNSLGQPLAATSAATCSHSSGCKLRVVANGCEWLRMAASDCGEWLRVASGCDWLGMGASGCKWLQMVADCSAQPEMNGRLEIFKSHGFAGTVVFSSLEII